MRSNMAVTAPGMIEISMTTTMPLSEWQALQKQLKDTQLANKWPASDLFSDITDMVTQATKHFYPTPKEEEKA